MKTAMPDSRLAYIGFKVSTYQFRKFSKSTLPEFVIAAPDSLIEPKTGLGREPKTGLGRIQSGALTLDVEAHCPINISARSSAIDRTRPMMQRIPSCRKENAHILTLTAHRRRVSM